MACIDQFWQKDSEHRHDLQENGRSKRKHVDRVALLGWMSDACKDMVHILTNLPIEVMHKKAAAPWANHTKDSLPSRNNYGGMVHYFNMDDNFF